MQKGEKRSYRNLVYQDRLKTFRIVVKETDLLIHADTDVKQDAFESVLRHRGYLESYIAKFPEFLKTLYPWPASAPCPEIVRDMINGAQAAGVGPMAAVAGAVAQSVGRDLLMHTDEVVVENGGDIFIRTQRPICAGVFAGNSPLSMRVGIRIDSRIRPVCLCTSSGTIGHSLSFGKADAVCVRSACCALADAAATAVGNRVKHPSDIGEAIEFGKRISGVEGMLIIMGESMGMWGDLELIPLNGKKP